MEDPFEIASPGLLGRTRFRPPRLAALLCLLALAAYAWSGGSLWLAYLLGAIGALLVLALAVLGWRRRRHASPPAALRKWLSTQLYLGLALVLIASLHSGFHFGWNVHSLCYALVLLVVGSGIYGGAVQLRHPRLIGINRGEETPAAWLAQLDDIDPLALQLASTLGGDVQQAVAQSLPRIRIGGGLREQLLGSQPSPQHVFAQLRQELEQTTRFRSGPNDEAMQRLLGLITRRRELSLRLERDIRLHAQMRIWLWLHVPLSFALLAALLVHLLSVFIYW